MRLAIGIFLLALLSLAPHGAGQTQVEVWRGWEGHERAGRWNPITVRVSDQVPRDAMIDLRSATEGGFGMQIQEHIAISPVAASFELYAPSHYSPWGQSVLVIRDADTGRTITQSPPHLPHGAPKPADVGPNGIFIGISGKPAELDVLHQSGVADAGYLPPRFLPRSAIGYDGVECLFLNRQDLDALDAEQQHAILDWVRAGGSLLYTPSDGPPPRHGDLVAVLPCKIGNIGEVELNDSLLKQAGLPSRFAHLTVRDLMPDPDAQPLQLLSYAKIVAYFKSYGLGRILVAPVDLASLEFNPGELKQKAPAFWNPILARLVGPPPEQPKRQYDAPFYGYESESEDQQREGAAVGTLCDFIAGPGPSVPRHVPLVLLGILMVIGPIDSIVLFARGNHPWTWTTAVGWVALLPAGVAFGIQHIRPAHVESRMVRVIDQVDDATVATTNLMGINASGRIRGIHLSGLRDDGEWWQPAVPGLAVSQAAPAQPDAYFHQSDAGNEPEPIPLVAGRLRFLRADRLSAGPGIVQIGLSLGGPSNAPVLAGTVRNISSLPLTNIHVRTRFGVVSVPPGPNGALASGQVLTIHFPAKGVPFGPQKVEGQYQSYGYFGSRHLDQGISEADLWAVAPDLSGRRSLRVDADVDAGGDYCCVYAQSVNPPAPALVGTGAQTPVRTYQWVRALARLK